MGKINLEDSLYFEFGGLRKGSAIAGINITCISEDFFTQNHNLIPTIEEAYKILMEIINGSRSEKNFAFFKLIKGDIRVFGKKLKDGEGIRFVESSKYAKKDVCYNNKTIRKIRSAYNSGTLERIPGVGRITGFRTSGSVYIQTRSHGDFTFKADPNKVISTFDGHVGSEVEYLIEAKISHGKIFDVKNCHYLELARKDEDANKGIQFMMKRLEEYRNYGKGWCEGEGEKINDTAIRNAKKLIEMTPKLANKYIMAPTLEGFVSIEFVLDGWKKCLDFVNQGVEVLEYDLAGRLGTFENFFEEIDSPAIDFISSHRVAGQ